jgi:hypothetical protein
MVISWDYRPLGRQVAARRLLGVLATSLVAAGALIAAGPGAASASTRASWDRVQAPRPGTLDRLRGEVAVSSHRAGRGNQAAGDGGQLWVSRYTGPGNSADGAFAVAVSPDGSTVFIAGGSASNGSADFATVAYDAVTGEQRWASRYAGEGFASAAAVSPDRETVFVTGGSEAADGGMDYLTVAYDAATGTQLWVRRYDGQADLATDSSVPCALVVSPDGSTIYVTGTSPGAAGQANNSDYVTIAYNAAAGTRRWLSRYGPHVRGPDQARAIAISPDGRTIYVTGRSIGLEGNYDAATVAYNAATGAQLWVSRYNGPANGYDAANSVAAAPGGRALYITGASAGKTSRRDLVTVAYRAGTGARLWVSRYNGPASRNDSGRSVAVTPDGRTVVVTGQIWDVGPISNYATVAYDARTGARRWLSRYAGTAVDGAFPAAMVISSDGSAVFATGFAQTATAGADYETVAYSTATGAQLWVSGYNGPASFTDEATALAVSPTRTHAIRDWIQLGALHSHRHRRRHHRLSGLTAVDWALRTLKRSTLPDTFIASAAARTDRTASSRTS